MGYSIAVILQKLLSQRPVHMHIVELLFAQIHVEIDSPHLGRPRRSWLRSEVRPHRDWHLDHLGLETAVSDASGAYASFEHFDFVMALRHHCGHSHLQLLSVEQLLRLFAISDREVTDS